MSLEKQSKMLVSNDEKVRSWISGEYIDSPKRNQIVWRNVQFKISEF